jgi:hypothetical protein
MAAIQKNEAIKAEKNPENTQGSNNTLTRKIILSLVPSGKDPKPFIRHLSTICPYTVKNIVPKI